MAQDKQNLLEMIDRPAFIVQDGIITDCNEMAKHRLIPLGEPVSKLLPFKNNAYNDYCGGILYLTLHLDWIRCGATVVRQEHGDVFLMDRDADQSQLQALALAGQQLRMSFSNVMVLADQLLPSLQEEPEKEMASQMYRSLFQLMRLISNMADAERCSNFQDITYERTELCSFFREITNNAAHSLSDIQVSIHYTCPDTPIFTVLDREQMERAVYNLLSNAVKFSEPGSSITVTLSRSGKMACFVVEDEGDGIADHVKGTLFHRYMREPAIEDSRFGLGLGMTLVRTAAAVHGGTVLLEQTKGTRVAMTMLISKDEAAMLRSPALRIGDYTGGRDPGLLEFSDLLPTSAYKELF